MESLLGSSAFHFYDGDEYEHHDPGPSAYCPRFCRHPARSFLGGDCLFLDRNSSAAPDGQAFGPDRQEENSSFRNHLFYHRFDDLLFC